jgi:hypothetical protein
MFHKTPRLFRHKKALTLFAIVPTLLATSLALAATRLEKERVARMACLGGDYTKGVNLLAELFVDTQNPTYIFNQGRCFEQNLKYAEAAARFEEYLRTPKAQLSADDRTAAENHIAECKKKLEEGREDTSPQPPPVVEAPTPLPEPAPELAASVVDQPAPPVEGRRRWGLVTAGIITSAVGVVGVATGVILNVRANSAIDDMQSKVGGYSNAKSSDQEGYKTAAWIAYGAGAVCTVTGAILIAVGAKRSKPVTSNQVALIPTVAPGQVGAMLRGGF